jgi:molybdopterin-guanine dinucleotide biosynthesis protein A
MGRDKALLEVEGTTLARRNASLLTQVVDTALEVGPGLSGLAFVQDELRGEGPLVAIATGWRTLRGDAYDGALVLACDLPFVNVELLRLLATWDSPHSVVPIVNDRAQPLCAKWGRDDLDGVDRLVQRGLRSLRHLTDQSNVTLLSEAQWGEVATAHTFDDVDSPDDVRRFGLTD